MKLRVMGTLDECKLAKAYYGMLERQDNVKYVSVSELYPNRGSNKLYRVYIEVVYKSEAEEPLIIQEQQTRFPALPKGKQ